MENYKAGTDLLITDTLKDSDNANISLDSLIDLTFTAYSLCGEVIAQWSMNNAGASILDVTSESDGVTFSFNVESDITSNYEAINICGEASWSDTSLSDGIRNVIFHLGNYTFNQCQ